MRPAKASARPRDLAHLDHPLELAPRHEPQRRRIDEAEQAVAADREAKEVGIFLAAAVQEVAAPRDEPERLDVVDERRHGEAAAVDVGGQAAADGDFVYAGLLLRKRPGLSRSVGLVRGIHRHELRLQEGEDLRPLDARLDLEQALLAVEREHPVELADVEHHGVGAELLAAHGVAPACDAHRAPLLARRRKQPPQRIGAGRRGDAKHPRRVELRVDVVDEDGPGGGLGGLLGGLGPRRLRPRRGERGQANEIPARGHAPDSRRASKLFRALDVERERAGRQLVVAQAAMRGLRQPLRGGRGRRSSSAGPDDASPGRS
jgi:hypothetical protein